MRLPLAFASLLLLSCTGAWAKEAAPDQNAQQPIGGGKPVTTTIIKRCPDGRELVVRANGSRGCAKDIVPPND
jgi:hypothetical protein